MPYLWIGWKFKGLRISRFIPERISPCSDTGILQGNKWWFMGILCSKRALWPKYLLIYRLMTLITLSGRRWNTHGSSKEGSGKEAGSEKASQKGGSKEEIIFIFHKEFFCSFILFSGRFSVRHCNKRFHIFASDLWSSWISRMMNPDSCINWFSEVICRYYCIPGKHNRDLTAIILLFWTGV